MIDPKKYMIVMAVAVVPRKDLGHDCDGCGRHSDPVIPMTLTNKDGRRMIVDPHIFVDGIERVAGHWSYPLRNGVSMEAAAKNMLETLFRDADEILKMDDGSEDSSPIVVMPARQAEEASA